MQRTNSLTDLHLLYCTPGTGIPSPETFIDSTMKHCKVSQFSRRLEAFHERGLYLGSRKFSAAFVKDEKDLIEEISKLSTDSTEQDNLKKYLMGLKAIGYLYSVAVTGEQLDI